MTTLAKAGPHQRVYDDINEKVMTALRKGNIIWRQPWGDARSDLPSNLVSRRRYRGWNLFYLTWMMQDQGFKSSFFVTFLQAQRLGGRILKGSKGFPIIKWVEKKDDHDEDINKDDDGQKRQLFPVMHMVFNVEQTEGIDYPSPEPRSMPVRPIEACEYMLARMQHLPPIETGGDRAAYRPGEDRIVMPPNECFEPPEEYYSTLYHEIIHSTGHAKRLSRQELMIPSGFGAPGYSREELTAEFGAAYLCGVSGISQQTVSNSAAYIRHWLGRLEEDPTLVYKACSKAQAAVDFLLPEQAT